MENYRQFKIHFKWIGSATWVLNVNNLKIACDPVLCPKGTVQTYGPGIKSERLTNPEFEKDDFKNVDMWLISHEHEDHIDKHGLSVINPETIIIANKKAKKILQTLNPINLNLIQWNQSLSYKIKDLTVEVKAIPTVHGSNPLTALFLRGGNGYWLTIRNADHVLDIYVTGDTINHEKVMKALRGHKADILIPNIGAPFQKSFGGPLTFTVNTLQPIIDTLKPDIILPVHFGTFSHFYESKTDVEKWADERIKIFSEGDCFQN